jgi:hypothetical protein
MRKLIAVVTRFLLLCAALLAFPASTAAQSGQLEVQRLWMQDAGGNDMTTFARGATIQFAAELNNSCGVPLSADKVNERAKQQQLNDEQRKTFSVLRSR